MNDGPLHSQRLGGFLERTILTKKTPEVLFETEPVVLPK